MAPVHAENLKTVGPRRGMGKGSSAGELLLLLKEALDRLAEDCERLGAAD